MAEEKKNQGPAQPVVIEPLSPEAPGAPAGDVSVKDGPAGAVPRRKKKRISRNNSTLSRGSGLRFYMALAVIHPPSPVLTCC